MSDFAARARSRLFRAPDGVIPGRIAMVLAGAAWTAFLWRNEPDLSLLGPVTAFFVSLTALLTAATGRWRFSAFISAGVFLAIWVASASKFALVAMRLHVYDVIFYGMSAAPIEFFLRTYTWLAVELAALALIGIGIFVVAWKSEKPLAFNWRSRLGAFAGAGALMSASLTPLVTRNADFFNNSAFTFSSFLGSLGDLPQLMQFNGVIETGPGPLPGAAVAPPIECRPGETPPDIVLTLDESALPPGVYDELVYPEELRPFFASFDGRIHPLRVETFGGGTWLTDFSVLTGLSTRSFGNLRNFAANFMTGRLHHSLPQYLKACGYETAIVYPASAGFAGVGRFYEAIGFDHVIDTSVHHAPDQRQRDAFYLGEMEKFLTAPAKDGVRRPRFVATQTMSTHSPWDFRFAPEALRPDEVTRWNADAEFDEYLWRLVLAGRDRDDFRARLTRELPDRKILYVDYGDHQPALAKVPLDNNRAIADEGRSWQLDPKSKAFQTYYALGAQNFMPAWPAENLPLVEAASLPTIVVQAAGLPLDPVFRRRAELLTTCNGLYATCDNRAAVLNFQRWLASTGRMALR